MTEPESSAWTKPPSPPPADAPPPYAAPAPYAGINDDQRSIMESKGKRAIGFGLAWIVGGLFITLLTLGMASGSDGGVYIVAWGPVLYGLWRVGSGIWTLSRSRG